jgi:hypothetical protein
MYKPIRRSLAVGVTILAAGCVGSEQITAPAGRPSLQTGWGYGSGGRTGADSTTTTQRAPAAETAGGADTTAVL